MSDTEHERRDALERDLEESESMVDRSITAATLAAVVAALVVLLGVGIGLAALT